MDLKKLKEGDLITIISPVNINSTFSLMWSPAYDYSYVGKCLEFLECVNGMLHVREEGKEEVIRLYKDKYENKIEIYQT